jgi:hypothetical protein
VNTHVTFVEIVLFSQRIGVNQIKRENLEV